MGAKLFVVIMTNDDEGFPIMTNDDEWGRGGCVVKAGEKMASSYDRICARPLINLCAP